MAPFIIHKEQEREGKDYERADDAHHHHQATVHHAAVKPHLKCGGDSHVTLGLIIFRVIISICKTPNLTSVAPSKVSVRLTGCPTQCDHLRRPFPLFTNLSHYSEKSLTTGMTNSYSQTIVV